MVRGRAPYRAGGLPTNRSDREDYSDIMPLNGWAPEMNWKGTGEGGDLPSNPHATKLAWRAEEGIGAGLPLH